MLVRIERFFMEAFWSFHVKGLRKKREEWKEEKVLSYVEGNKLIMIGSESNSMGQVGQYIYIPTNLTDPWNDYTRYMVQSRDVVKKHFIRYQVKPVPFFGESYR